MLLQDVRKRQRAVARQLETRMADGARICIFFALQGESAAVAECCGEVIGAHEGGARSRGEQNRE